MVKQGNQSIVCGCYRTLGVVEHHQKELGTGLAPENPVGSRWEEAEQCERLVGNLELGRHREGSAHRQGQQ